MVVIFGGDYLHLLKVVLDLGKHLALIIVTEPGPVVDCYLVFLIVHDTTCPPPMPCPMPAISI